MQVESRQETLKTIAEHSRIDATYFTGIYKYKLSGYGQWQHKPQAGEYLLYPQNMGKWLSIDEVSLSQGELYTILTNKNAKGGKGSLVAVIRGTRVEQIVHVLGKLPLALRQGVREVTLDMASNMTSAVRSVFAAADLVTNRGRFHRASLRHHHQLLHQPLHQCRCRILQCEKLSCYGPINAVSLTRTSSCSYLKNYSLKLPNPQIVLVIRDIAGICDRKDCGSIGSVGLLDLKMEWNVRLEQYCKTGTYEMVGRAVESYAAVKIELNFWCNEKCESPIEGLLYVCSCRKGGGTKALKIKA